MYSLPGWFWSLPFPPLQESPGFLPSRAFPSPLYFRPFCLLSVHKRLFSRPPPVSGPPHRPSPIVLPSKSYQPSGFGRPMSSSVFPNQRPICRFAPPPYLCGWWYLAWVYFFPSMMILVPSFSPPTRVTRVLDLQSIPVSSLLSSFLPPLRP